jgi:hypothetical protein
MLRQARPNGLDLGQEQRRKARFQVKIARQGQDASLEFAEPRRELQRRKVAVGGKRVEDQVERDALVLDHSEQDLRPRAGKRRGEGEQRAAPGQLGLERRELPVPIAAETVEAERPSDRLVLQPQHAAGPDHPQHLLQHPPWPEGVVDRGGAEDEVEIPRAEGQVVEVARDERRLRANSGRVRAVQPDPQ